VTRVGLALALPLLLLAGCSDEEPDAPDAADPPAASDIAYPDEGVDLVDQPDLKGVYADALQVYVDFERGRRLAAREGVENRLLVFNATGKVSGPIKEAAEDSGGGYDGTVTLEFLSAKPRDTVLRLDVCVDGTALEVPDDAPALLGEATRAPQRVEVSNLTGPWRVTEVEAVGGSC
jgi:hypothetical protein